MTDEQLVQAIQKGEAQPIEIYLRMKNYIRKMALRYGKDNVDDLVQESYFAVMDAVRLYDPEGGTSFKNYLIYWLKRVMSRYSTQYTHSVRLPDYSYNRVWKYQRMCKDFMRDFGRMPTSAEIRTAIGVDREQLEREAQMLEVGSLDTPIGEDLDNNLVDLVPDDSVDVEAEVLDKVQAEQLKTTLWELVDTLPARQAQVIRMRFQEGKLLRECGDVIGVSVERIRSDEAAALRKLRSTKIRRQLEPYLDDIRYANGVRTGWQYLDGEKCSPTEYAAIKAASYLDKLRKDGVIS